MNVRCTICRGGRWEWMTNGTARVRVCLDCYVERDLAKINAKRVRNGEKPIPAWEMDNW